MNNSKFNLSLNDSAELRKLIIENPDLPLLCFAGEDAWIDEYSYEQAEIHGCKVDTLTLYNNYWINEDDYRDRISDDMANEERYENIDDGAFNLIVEEKIKNTEFVKAIVFYVG